MEESLLKVNSRLQQVLRISSKGFSSDRFRTG
jgi:hypothetical protein